jgi:phage shock protein C
MRERLYRSRTDRILFGVAGGFADWLDVDPALVRLVWALLVFAGGAGLLLYLVAAIVIPEEPWEPAVPTVGASGPGSEGSVQGGAGGAVDAVDGSVPAATAAAAAPNTIGMTRREAREARRAARRAGRGAREGSGALVLGVILVLVGAWFLARDFLPGLDDRIVVPGVLIVIGVVFVIGSLRQQDGPPG